MKSLILALLALLLLTGLLIFNHVRNRSARSRTDEPPRFPRSRWSHRERADNEPLGVRIFDEIQRRRR